MLLTLYCASLVVWEARSKGRRTGTILSQREGSHVRLGGMHIFVPRAMSRVEAPAFCPAGGVAVPLREDAAAKPDYRCEGPDPADLVAPPRDRELRYRTLVENSGMGIMHVDLEYRIVAASSADTHVSSAAGTLVGQHCYRAFHSREQLCENCPGKTAMATGQPAEMERTCVREDGTSMVLRVQAFPLLGPDHQPTGFIEVVEDITERRKTQDELGHSQALLIEAQRLGNIGSWEWNVASGRLTWSEQLYRIFGGDSQSLVPTHQWFIARVHPDDRQLVRDVLADVLATGQPYDLEYRIVTEAGSLHVLHASGEVLMDSAGRPGRMVGTVLDITQRKRSEDFLREERDLARDVAMSDDLATTLTRCLDAALRISGLHCGGIYLRDECSGEFRLAVHQGVSPPFVEAVTRHNTESPNSGLVMPGQPMYVLAHDVDVPFFEPHRREGLQSIAILPVRHGDQVIGCMNLASRLAEEIPPDTRMMLERIAGQIGPLIDRARTEAKLRESEDTFRQLAENIKEVFWLASPDMRQCFYVSPAYDEMYGRSRRELQSNPDAWLDYIHPDDRDRVEALARDSSRPFVCEYRTIRPDGSPRWIHARGFPVYDASGAVYRIAGIAKDVTLRKQTTAALSHLASFPQLDPSPVVEIRLDGVVSFINPAATRLFPDLRQRGFTHPFLHGASEALREMERSGNEFLQREVAVGSACFVQTLCLLADHSCLRVYGMDITDRKRSEDALRVSQTRLRRLAMEASLVEARERRKLAEDLHDGLGQVLTRANLKLALARQGGADPRQTLEEVSALIDQASRSARSATLHLSHPALYELGFVAAAEWLAEDMQAEYGLSLCLTDDGQPKPIHESARVILFRCLREVLINVAKHAQVNEASVRIERREDMVHVTVEDRGVGFDLELTRANATTGGFGLFSVCERLAYLGGRSEIQSSPGSGTRVILTAPVNEAATTGGKGTS